MRFTAPIAALVLAGIAWVACWQEVELLRLKRQLPRAAAPGLSASVRPEPAPESEAPVRLPTFHAVPSAAPVSSLDQLRTLLAERKQAIADARDAASDFGIAKGTPEMERAILLATQEVDRSIIALAGPTVAAQLTMPVPQAAIPADVQVAPPPMPAVVMIGGPSPEAPIVAPTTNVFVNVTTPPPAVIDNSSPPADPSPSGSAYQPYLYGGLGASYGRTKAPTETPTQKLQYFAAGAGIPLTPSPLGMVVATSPLLLMKQRTASAATGR